MEAAVIVALIAAGVSLVGMMMSLEVARRARQAADVQARIAVGLAEAQEALKHLRAYTADVEKLRAEASLVQLALERPANHAKAHRELRTRAEAFQMTFGEFFRAWADVKSDVPDARLEYLRMIRHAARTSQLMRLGYWKNSRAEKRAPRIARALRPRPARGCATSRASWTSYLER